MTEISFYTFAENKLAVARQLTAKAYTRGLHVMLYAPDPAQRAALDTLLWTTPAQGFLPHCPDIHPLAPHTPVLIGEHVDRLAQADVIINLYDEHPPAFSRFQRLLEIISTEAQDVEQGRQRYRFYRERGYALSSIDLRSAVS